MKLISGAAVAALAVAVAGSTQALAKDDYEGEAAAHTRKAAVSAAIADWKREVKEETGHWARWKTATNKEIECDRERNGAVECEVEAVPAH